MQTIFDREFRREKNLEIMKREAAKASGVQEKKGTKTAEQIQKEKEERMVKKISEIEEGFFKHVSTDAEDLDAIRARGEMN